jgi:hypothetical protein
MKLRRSFAPVALALASAALLAGCGGNDEAAAGGQAAFNIVPTQVTLTGPDANTCASGYAGRVHVFGGAGPYEVFNTDPSVVSVSKTSVSGPGDYFDVFLPTSTCLASIPVVVRDRWGRQVTLSINSVKGAT